MVMIKFKTLTIQNFMSFGNKATNVDLSTPGLRLILGENKDTEDGSGTSNGSGKSSINQALIYALFGRGLDKMKSDEMINLVNAKKLLVELSFEKKGEEYVIRRGRKPNLLEFYQGDESLTLDSMANTDALIQQVIGLDFDVFITSFYLSPYKESFLAMTPADQRSLFEILLSLDTLTERAETLKLIRKDLEVDSKVAVRDIENAEATNKKLSGYLATMEEKKRAIIAQRAEIQEYLDELDAFDIEGFKDLLTSYKTHEQNLKSLKEEALSAVRVDLASIVDLSTVVNNKERELDNAQKVLRMYETFDQKMSQEIKELETKLNENFKKPEDYEEIITDDGLNRRLEQELDETVKEHERTEEKLEKLTTKLKKIESNECPTCGQTYCFDNEEINTLKKTLNETKDNLIELEQNAGKLVEQLDESKIRDDIDEIKRKLDEYQRLSEKLNVAIEKAKENPYEDQIKELNADKLVEELNELKKKDEQNQENRRKLEETEKKIKETITETEKKLDETLKKIEATGFYSLKELEDDKEKFTRQLDELTTDEVNGYIRSYEQDMIDIEEVSKQLKEIENDTEHCKYLIKLLTDSKGFIRRNIVNQFVPFLNKKILEFTDMLGLRHVISINSDLTSSISIMNSEVGYWNLSQGERLRVNLAVTIAFRELLKMLGKSTNLIILDEQLDGGSDTSFVVRALKFLDQHVNSGLIVSHKEDVYEHIENRIKVVKENGFSRIET